MKKAKNLFNIGNPYSRYLTWLMLMLVFLFNQRNAFCMPANKVPFPRDIFSMLSSTSTGTRVALADKLYKDNFRHSNAPVAMANLDSLFAIAQSLNDKPLECAVFDMRADYYSVNNGFNNLSTAYYLQAINFAAENDMPLQNGIYLQHLGRYYFVYKHFTEAFRSYLESEEKFREIGFDKVPGINIYLTQVADLYYGLGDFDSANASLQEALKYCPANNRDKINIINTIGLIYRSHKQYGIALNYFNNALKIATAIRDTVWKGIATGNIGSVYFMEGRYNEALPYIETDYKVSLSHQQTLNGIIALLRLIKISTGTKHFEEAASQLDTAGVILAAMKEDVLGQWADYYELKSGMCERNGRLKDALAYRKIFEADKDSVIKRNDIAAVERIRLRWETDKSISQANKYKVDEKIKAVEINASFAVVVLLVIISILVYNRQRQKSNKDKELLLAEKRVVDKELENAGKSLNQFTENLRMKNLLIEKSRLEIERLSKQSEVKANAGHLEKLLQAHIMTDENWSDFKVLFSKVYPGFFVGLNKNYTRLSATDTRILALMKLGLNNAEMANMLGITIEGIKKAKQRLRKKMDIDNIERDGTDL